MKNGVQPPPEDGGAAVVSRRFGDVTVHAVRLGWVMCKEAHRTLTAPEALRFPAIILDRRWTEWMPVTGYVIDHPEGAILVDAGQTEDTAHAERLDCDAPTRWFYAHLLRLAFRADDRIDRRLAALDIPPHRVSSVVLTHRHADHADGLGVLPATTRVYVGRGDWPAHNGALTRHWPAGRVPTLVGPEGASFGALPHATPLTRDGRVRAVPLPGHSPGHLGVLAELDGRWVLFAGDAAFDLEQVRTRTLAGICERPGDARRTLGAVAAQLRHGPTIMLLAHERASADRLARAECSA